ncbi:MAG: hypothetical protein IT204_24885 [Fimbriimonadaceae bacterium]|nr:hypothetical protein [Fimbriimonadaceae bacterium]
MWRWPWLLMCLSSPLWARPGEVDCLLIHGNPLTPTQPHGLVLRLRASVEGPPGQTRLRHGGPVSAATRQGVTAATEWLAGAAAQELIGAARQRGGVRWEFSGWSDGLEGGSAGLAMAVAAVGCLWGVESRPEAAVSGLLDDGQVRRVEKADLKVAAAIRAGYGTVVLPLPNARELAAGGFETFSRVRLVGVETVGEAVFELLGGGPQATEQQDYQDLYEAGLELLARGDPAAAAQRWTACLEFCPGDVSAAWWREQATGRLAEDALLRAAAWRRLGRWDDARQEVKLASSAVPHRIEQFSLELRREEALQAARQPLQAARTALEAGDLDGADQHLRTAAGSAAAAPAALEIHERLRLALAAAIAARAAGQHPAGLRAWATAAAAAADWEQVARAWERLGQVGPADPQPRVAAAAAWAKLGEPGLASQLLRANLQEWPADRPTRLKLADLGVDAEVGPVACTPPGEPWRGVVRLGAGAAEPRGTVWVGCGDDVLGHGPLPLTVRVATDTWSAGPRRLWAVARDAAGNVGWHEQPVVVRSRGRLARGLPAGAPGYAVALLAGGTYLLRATDRLRLSGTALFGAARRRAGLDAADLRCGVGPTDCRLAPGAVVELAASELPTALQLWAVDCLGRSVGPVQVRLDTTATVLAQIVEPRGEVRGVRPLRLRVDPSYEPVLARLLVDQEVVAEGDPADLQLDPRRLAAGPHSLAVWLSSSDNRHHQTPPVALQVVR